MTENLKPFLVIKFNDLPDGVKCKYKCVPRSWMKCDDGCDFVAIAYPTESELTTLQRVANSEIDSPDWKWYSACVVCSTDSFEDAIEQLSINALSDLGTTVDCQYDLTNKSYQVKKLKNSDHNLLIKLKTNNDETRKSLPNEPKNIPMKKRARSKSVYAEANTSPFKRKKIQDDLDVNSTPLNSSERKSIKAQIKLLDSLGLRTDSKTPKAKKSVNQTNFPAKMQPEMKSFNDTSQGKDSEIQKDPTYLKELKSQFNKTHLAFKQVNQQMNRMQKMIDKMLAAKNTSVKVKSNNESTDLPTKWTLNFPQAKPGLVELIPGSGVFIKATGLVACTTESNDQRRLANTLLKEVFTNEALRSCSLTGGKPKGLGSENEVVRPGLDPNALKTLLRFVEHHAIEMKWPHMDEQLIKTTLRGKLQGLKNKKTTD